MFDSVSGKQTHPLVNLLTTDCYSSPLMATTTTVEKMLGCLKHLVIVEFKEDVVVEEVVKYMEKFVYEEFNHLVISFEWVHVSGSEEILKQVFSDVFALSLLEEFLRQGFTHIFTFTFRNPEKLNSYLAHPTHFKFADTIGTLIKNVRVLDFPAVMVKKPAPPPNARFIKSKL